LNIGMGPNGDGWHAIELRFRNGIGGAGPTPANGFNNNYGLGLNLAGMTALDGAVYSRPVDPGVGTLFRTPLSAKGILQVEGGATLNVLTITNTALLAVSAVAGSGGSTVNLVDAGQASASQIDGIQVAGTTGSATLSTTAASSLTVGNVTLAGGTTLNYNGAANRLVITGNATGGTINSTGAAGVSFNSPGPQAAGSIIAGNGGLTKEGTGRLTLTAACTYAGATTVNGGTLEVASGSGGPEGALPATTYLTIDSGASVVLRAGRTKAVHLAGLSIDMTGLSPPPQDAAPVPEPGTPGLLAAAGLLGFLAWLRRRRA
jgi:autotransporter-associated beta strand protein